MTRNKLFIFLLLFVTGFQISQAQTGFDEKILGEIFIVGFDYCPEGSLPADGRLLPIENNENLFSILHNTYGGDFYKSKNFALPDLRGRTLIGENMEPNWHNWNNKNYLTEYKPGESFNHQQGNQARHGYLALKYCINTDGPYPNRP